MPVKHSRLTPRESGFYNPHIQNKGFRFITLGNFRSERIKPLVLLRIRTGT